MFKPKKETDTSRVMRALLAADDFLTAHELQRRLLLDCNHVSAALYHLRKYKAADFVEAPEALWWFATPESDTRQRKVHERTAAVTKRKRRKTAGKPRPPLRVKFRRYKA